MGRPLARVSKHVNLQRTIQGQTALWLGQHIQSLMTHLGKNL